MLPSYLLSKLCVEIRNYANLTNLDKINEFGRRNNVISCRMVLMS